MDAPGRTLPWDWHSGSIPENVIVDATAYLESTYSFLLFKSAAPVGVRIGPGASVYQSTMFDVGVRGQVTVGGCTLVNGARIICDAEVEIGDYTLISWNVVLMDAYRVLPNPAARRRELECVPWRRPRCLEVEGPARPVRIGRNVWIGFEACVLPGVSVGEGAVVGARAVVAADVPPYAVVAGNPARVIRYLEEGNQRHAP
jgi:acetyltransferase-like isoleucine patch superfamily enzyme